MEIIMPEQEEKNVIHPIAIFKQAWSIGWKNLRQLSVVYLVFNLPITVISMSLMVRSLPDQKPSLAAFLGFLLLIVISSWGHIALLLSADKAVGAQDYTIGQSISQAKVFLVKYLALIISFTLFMMGIIIVAGIFVVVVWAFLLQVNKILAGLICFALTITVIAFLVCLMLRWSLAAVACVLENAWPVPAVKRSFSLVKDKINPVVGIYGLMTLVYIVYLVPMMIAGGWLDAGKNTRLASQADMTVYILFSFLISTVLVPFGTIIIVVLYKKLKEVLEAHVYA
jgi:hypothetical protein